MTTKITADVIEDGSITAAKLAGGTLSTILGTANTFTADQTIRFTDAGAGVGPDLFLDRNSSSPAASDLLGGVTFLGRSSTAVSRTYARIRASIVSATNAAESGLLKFRTILAGTEADRVIIGSGLYTATATGGDKGANTVNASDYYKNGALLPAYFTEYDLGNYTNSTTYTQAHGLSYTPQGEWFVEFKNAVNGYAVGDRMPLGSIRDVSQNVGVTVAINATNCYFVTSASPFYYFHFGTHALVNPAVITDFKVILRVYK